VEWPCTLHRWFWAYLAVPVLVQLERLTFRRTIYLAVLTLLIVAFAQGFSIDLAFLWAGDTAFYFEVASAVMFFAVRGHAGQMARVVEQKTQKAAWRMNARFKRYLGTVRQCRNANAMRRKNRASRPKCSDDEPAGWIGGLYARA